MWAICHAGASEAAGEQDGYLQHSSVRSAATWVMLVPLPPCPPQTWGLEPRAVQPEPGPLSSCSHQLGRDFWAGRSCSWKVASIYAARELFASSGSCVWCLPAGAILITSGIYGSQSAGQCPWFAWSTAVLMLWSETEQYHWILLGAFNFFYFSFFRWDFHFASSFFCLLLFLGPWWEVWFDLEASANIPVLLVQTCLAQTSLCPPALKCCICLLLPLSLSAQSTTLSWQQWSVQDEIEPLLNVSGR